MGKSIIVASAKGGVGKTTVVSNLSVALARQGKKVIVVDGSLTTPDLFLHLGVPFHVHGLANLLKDNAPLESALFHHKSGMEVIPGALHQNVLKEFEGKAFSSLLKQLKKKYDYVFVDSAAGLGREALSAMKRCDQLLIVTNPELPAVVDASKAIQAAKKTKVKLMGVVLNRVGRFNQELQLEEIESLLHKVPVIKQIPEDVLVAKAIKCSEAVVDHAPKSQAGKALHHLSLIFDGQNPSHLSSSFHQEKGFFAFLRRLFSRKY
jgi:septum site-determining protein MinD